MTTSASERARPAAARARPSRWLGLLALMLWMLPIGAWALSCPANKECVPVSSTPWCWAMPNSGCGVQPPGDFCPERATPGFRSYEAQMDWQIVNLIACSGYVSGSTIGPYNAEICTGGSGVLTPTSCSQTWRVSLTSSNGNSVEQHPSGVRQRFFYCPAGYSTNSTQGRCERERVPCDGCEGEGSSGANTLVGNPISPYSQEKRLAVTDHSGSGGPSLTRYYNSQSPHQPEEPGSTSPLPFGPNWSSNWHASLRIDSTTMRALRPNGTQVQFTQSGGNWTAWQGETMVLYPVSPPAADGTAWTLTLSNDTVEGYDTDGKLLHRTARDARRFTLEYDVQGRLESVRSDSGRALNFTWSGVSGADRIASVETPDGTTLSYAYDPIYTQLTIVSDSLGPRVTYLYGEPAFSASVQYINNYLLTGVLDASGSRYATYRYAADGSAFESFHAGDVNKFTVEKGSSVADITSATGFERRVFSLIAGARRVTSVVRRACSSCPILYTRTYSYDANGFTNVAKDFNGTNTDHDYDARGLEIRRIEAQGKDTQPANPVSQERKIETDWHASLRVPNERRIYRCSAPNTSAQACSTATSTRWQLESLSRYAYNARGQATAMCQVDPGNGTALAYVCGSSTNAPAGVRQTLTRYCEPADVSLGTCPLIGLVTATDGPRTDVSDVSAYTYFNADHASCASAPTTCPYRKGDLQAVSNALSQSSQYLSYDGAGRVTRMMDANGVISDLSYHPRGWLLTRTLRANSDGTPNAALDAVTTLSYNGDGQVTRVTQPDGAYIDYTYDAAHRLTDITDNLGNTLSYTLDAAGNRTAENTRDPSNTLTRTLGRVYDSLGRLHKLLNAQSAETVFTYDGNGNQDTVTDALLRVTDSNVDPLNRLIQSTDALMGNTQYRYDARDNLTRVIDAKGLATDYVYDGLSDLMQLVSPDTGTTNYTYDSAGNRATQTDARGVTSTYSHDVLNRLTGIAYPTSSHNVAFSYDQNHAACASDELFGIGRLTGFSDPSGSTQLCYDRRGNVVRKIAVVNGITTTTRWAYNKADRMTQLVYPSGSVVNYSHDALGRISAINVTPAGGSAQTLVSAVSYYPYGPVKQITWGNGATSLRSYDQNYWIDSINSSQASGLDLEFTLDAVGNITGLSDVIGGVPPNNSYSYDALYRLTDVDSGVSNVESYSYDPIGNRLSKLIGAAPAAIPYTYPPTSHRLSSVGGVSRSYDANGNTLAQDTGASAAFAYDERNRLAARMVSGNASHGYAYNARGERVLKTDVSTSANSRLYAYDESGRLLSESDSSGAALQEMLWLDDLPVGVIAGGVLHHIQPDHLGSPRKVIDATANAAIWDWPILDNPFGEAAPDQDPDGNSVPFVMNLRFPGQYFDAETGLHYNYFRDYEPGTGRYVESDPIGLRGGVNSYAYVDNAPTIWTDALGLKSSGGYNPYEECVAKATKKCAGSFSWVCQRFGGYEGAELIALVERCKLVARGSCRVVPDRVVPPRDRREHDAAMDTHKKKCEKTCPARELNCDDWLSCIEKQVP